MSGLDQAVNSMIQNLQEKTGKSLEEWLVIARGSGHAKHRELLNYLKGEHGLSYGYANFVALRALESQVPRPAQDADLVAPQYAGAKAALRPIYDALLEIVHGFGGDIEVAPKKAYVSLRRTKQFAIVQPSTSDRLDLGVNLKHTQPTERLQVSGSFNTMVSHRVRLRSKEELDTELLGWLRQAYDEA